MTKRYDSNRTAESKATAIHRRSIRSQSAAIGFRVN